MLEEFQHRLKRGWIFVEIFPKIRDMVYMGGEGGTLRDVNGEYGLKTLRRERVKGALLRAGLIACLAAEPLISCGGGAGNAAVMRREVISGLISGRARDKDAEAALDAMQRFGTRESAALVGHVPEQYERASALMAGLGITRDDASARLNFAYAIAAIGPQKTAALYRSLGIEYFMRYSREMLEMSYDTLEQARPERPLLVVAFNKNDHNGAFYREGLLLDPLLRAYRPLVFETDSEDGLYSRIGEIAGRFGRISTLVIGGHGEAGAIQLGDMSEKGRIDLGDYDELVALRDFFASRPLIILVSCSTGESDRSIGASLSRALDAYLYAPVTPSARTTYNLDGSGYITSVSYDVQTRSYLDGIVR